MATTIPTPGPSVTRQALQDATQEFQSVLDDDQRQELLKIKQDPVPDAEAILVFTARLDSINQHRKGQSFGSRLHKFLSSIRDFCGVIDTYVSAHPEIAALVWAILIGREIVANFTSYYDAMSTLFTKMGDLCPLYAEYRILFNESAGLRKSLVAIRRPWATHLMKALHSPFDQEFKPDLDEIQRYGNNVENQIFLAKAQADKQHQKLQETERVEASKSRAVAREHITRTDLTLSTLQNSQIQSDLEKSRKQGSEQEGCWILFQLTITHGHSIKVLENDMATRRTGSMRLLGFNNGLTGPTQSSGVLAKLGVVKLSPPIKHIQRPIPAGNTPSIAYMFMQADDNDSLDANIVLRTLLRQLLDETMVFGELANMLHAVVSSSDQSEIIELLLRLMAAPKKAYIFIDGIDECSKEDRRELFKALSMLVTASENIRLYLSSRESIGHEVKACFLGFEHISLDCQATRTDIANYITNTIDEKLQQGELKIGDGELVDEIKNALVNGAQGMYLWAYFQIEEVCFQHCDQDIRQALKDLPRDLAEMFRRVLRRINIRRHGPAVRRVTPLVAAAKRPLSIGELREATAVEVGQHHLEASRLFNDMGSIASWSENLIQVDEDNDTVQFAHSAVKDYLVDISSDSDSTLADFHIDLEISDHQLGEICVTYLNFDNFKASVAFQPKPMTMSPMQIIPTVIKPALGVRTMFSDLNIIPGGETVDLRRRLSSFLSAQSPSAEDTWKVSHPFLDYASTSWITHTKNFHQETSKTWKIWESLLTHGHAFAKVPANTELFDIILDEHCKCGSFTRENGSEALRDAVTLKMGYCVDRLLAVGVDVNSITLKGDERGQFDQTPNRVCALHISARNGYLDTVNSLLKAGADLNLVSGCGRTALQMAAAHGEPAVVRALLASGAEVDFRFPNKQTVLQAAAEQGHLEVTKKREREVPRRLLTTGSDPSSPLTNIMGTALEGAAEHGHLEVVNVLLEAGVDPNTPPSTKQGNALVIAAGKMHVGVVECVACSRSRSKLSVTGRLQNGTRLSCGKGPSGNKRGFWQIADALLKAGADSNAANFLQGAERCGENDTAVRKATESGHFEVVNALISYGRREPPTDGFAT
ncbi:hypothetical protein PG990_008102 [Apiospora arundinis]